MCRQFDSAPSHHNNIIKGFRAFFLYVMRGIICYNFCNCVIIVEERIKCKIFNRGESMKILLVNDDGIKSSRLHFAKEVLKEYGDVWVVAPVSEQSGKSVAITIGKIAYKKVGKQEYAIDGTPADCVSFGLYGLNIKPDVVVSGINRGYNLGVDTMYSGTVGAALQANYHGCKAVAFSGDYQSSANIESGFKEAFDYILKENLLSLSYILNVNFPTASFKSHLGIKHTETTYGKFELKGELKKDYFISTRKKRVPGAGFEKSDVYAIENGYISIARMVL